MSARGFTLIELLISLGLGVVLVYTSFAGFRVASQSVVVSNRLSLENSLMRAGYFQSHDNVDFWTDCDDPEDTPGGIGQPLRRMGPLTFTPVKDAIARSGTTRERQRGWNRDERWKPCDPATWWRGSLAESYRGDLRFGRYAIFTNTDDPAAATVDGAMEVKGNAAFGGDYGAVDVPHCWLDNQLHGLLRGLHFYGAAEYLPSNTIFAAYQPYVEHVPGWGGDWVDLDAGTGRGGCPQFYSRWNSRFCNDDGVQQIPRGLWRLTMASAFLMVRPEVPGSVGAIEAPATLVDCNDHMYRIGYTANVNDTGPEGWQAFQKRSAAPRALFPAALQPAHWPSVTVSTARFIKNRRFIAMNRVRWISPTTGEVAEISFSGFGTSLRGARQQRAQGVGWADWDDAPSTVNPPTLDDYP
jgi:prepilin-type N-terminal cleavage/methylation domain-containing protein